MVNSAIDTSEELDLSIYAKNTDLNKLNSAITSLSKSLKGYAKSSDIPDTSGFVKKDELPTTDLTGLASKDWVESQGYLKNQSLKGYVKEAAIKDMATKSWVENALAGIIDETGTVDLNGYAKIEDIPTDYVTPATLTNLLKQYAKLKDVPKLDGLATEAWVQENFLSEQQDLSEFAKKTDLNKYVETKTLNTKLAGYVKNGDVWSKAELNERFLSQTDANNKYLKIADANSTFMSKAEVKRDYLRIEDYRGMRELVINQEILKDALVINGEYDTLEELQANMNNLANGFYVVTDGTMYIVKNHTIISSIEGGIPQDNIKLEWDETPEV